jgi:hypothetical protein
MTTIELGNIESLEQTNKIIEKLNGQTYMNFIVSYSVSAHNYPVSVSTENENVTEEELKDIVLFYLAASF